MEGIELANPYEDAYEAAQEATQLETSELKAALPIAYVLQAADVEVSQQSDGKLLAHCPFHSDSSPSFDVYGEKLERWGCYPCSLGGDVFDLIGRLFSITEFVGIKRKAVELLTEMGTVGWTGPRSSEKKSLDTNFVRQVVESATDGDLDLVEQLITKKDASYSAVWLRDTFSVGQYGHWVVIPYFNGEGNLVTFKHRSPTTKPISVAGSEFSAVLYGEWRDSDESKPVLLCEGESDVWAATHAVGEKYAVLGVPTGAGSIPKSGQLARLAKRQVVVAFDGDRTGRSAVRSWHSALVKSGSDVRVVSLPEDKDLSSVDDIAATVATARPVLPVPRGLKRTDQGYVKPPKDQDDIASPITNWVFTPTRELVGEGGAAFEGTIEPGGRETVLSSFDLGSKPRMVQWAAKHGGAWYGSDRDAQLLLGLLQAEAPFLATGRMATVAGLHEGHFIWPGSRIGPDHWQYVAPAADVSLHTKINIVVGHWEPTQIMSLRQLHEPRVMDPILSWLAAAPVRSLLREFPILAVTGPSGAGKTTLMETVIPAFSGADITTNLTSTTKHALFAFVGSTNAFPVRFDEYRNGMRADTKATFEQTLRDLYTAQESAKGGLGDHWAKVGSVAATAPVVVSGEDSFDETSHTERMVLVHLPIGGRNPDALKEVRSWGPTGFPYAYMQWLHEGLRSDWLPPIRNEASGPDHLPQRQRLNLGVLELGWSLLTHFLGSFGIELPDPDWSLIITEAEDAMSHSPIEDALLWALDEPEAMFFIGLKNDVPGCDKPQVVVRLENFIHFIKGKSEFTLPGGVTAIRKYLEAKYGARTQTIEHAHAKKTMLFFDYDLLQLRK